MLRQLFLFAFLLFFTAVGHAQNFEVYKGDTINFIDKNGLKQGQWIVFNSDQTRIIEEGKYKDNKKTGLWKKYYNNGNLQSKITYKNGEADGPTKIYYKNGNLSETGIWKGDKWVGEYKFYHKNGKPAYVWKYNEKGKRSGIQKYFYADGSLKIEGKWSNGEKNGVLKEFYDDGNLKSKIVYNDGKMKEGSRKKFDRNTSTEEDREEPTPVANASVEEKKEDKTGVFKGSGYNEIYNTDKQLIQKGTFRDGKLYNGEKYFYDDKGNKIRTIIIKSGRTHKVINH